ncbi:MAG: winged helix-turn-helix domain-containing protein, partial [Woeseiaceae bacterium]|nr:winged helix-turn-helix domain-containing protein [Woeseiaceae bacterium]
MDSTDFTLGRWTVRPTRNLLESVEENVVLEPRLMRLLVLLAARPGEVVPKESLLEDVWNGTAASDESLARAISSLRRTLGDDSANPDYIETIRKRGYRLVADVGAPSAGSRTGGGLWLAVAAVAIAVVGAAAYVASRQADESPAAAGVLTAEPVTRRPGRERDPDVSADGRYVVYSANEGEGHQIYLHGVDRGTADRRLTRRGDNRAPRFTRSGETVLFQRFAGERCTVIELTLVDGAERIAGDCSGNGYADLAVSPDDRRVAFNVRGDDGLHAIEILNLDDGRRRRVTAPPAGIWGDFDPVFGADGESLVFARSVSEGMQDLYTVKLDTGEERRLTSAARNVFGIAVLGERVLYSTNVEGRYHLRDMHIDGRDSRRLPIDASGIVNPAVAEDGSRLVFEVVDRAVSLHRIDLRVGGQSAELLSFNADLLHPDVAPDGSSLVFSSNRSGHYEIWTSDDAGRDLRRLTDLAGGFTAHPRYSPDGTRIAFDARPGSHARIFVMPAAGVEPRALTPDGVDAYAPTWSPDGSALYYASTENGALDLWQFRFADGTRRVITTTGAA